MGVIGAYEKKKVRKGGEFTRRWKKGERNVNKFGWAYDEYLKE